MKGYFKKIDFISEEVGFEVESSRIYKTNFGAFITLLIIITSIIVAFMIGNEVYERKTPNISSSSNYLSNSNFTLKDYPLFFLVSDTNGKFIKDYDKYLEFIYYKFNRTNSLTDYSAKINKVASKCTMESFNAFIGKIDNTTLLSYVDMPTYCVSWDEEDFIKNDYAYTNSSYLNFAFQTCQNKEINNCAEDIDQMLKEIYVRLFYMNSYEDSLDYKNPIKYYIDVISQQITSSSLKRNYVKFTNNEFVSDNGWLFDDKKEYKYISLDRVIAEINSKSPTYPSHMYWITIVSPQIRNYSIRKYMKIQDLFANIGGIINALVIISKLMFYHYLKYTYNLNIAEYLLNEETKSKDSEIIKKISISARNIFSNICDYSNVADDSKNINNMFNSKFLNKECLSDNLNRNKEERENKSKINSNKSISDIYADNKSNIKESNNNIIINNPINNSKINRMILSDNSINNNKNANQDLNLFNNNNNNLNKSEISNNLGEINVKELINNPSISNINKTINNFNNKNDSKYILKSNNIKSSLFEKLKVISYYEYLYSLICCCSFKNKEFIKEVFAYVDERIDFFKNIKTVES